MNLYSEPGPDGVSTRVVINSSPTYGLAFGVRYNDEDVIEFRWARQETKLHIVDAITVPALQRVILDQFHMDFSHEYVIREWPVWARPYVIGSVGATRLSSTATTASFTRLSFGLGAGLKAFPSRHVGFKLQAQWLPLWVNPDITAFCSFGCVIHLGGQMSSQGEVTIGPIFRF